MERPHAEMPDLRLTQSLEVLRDDVKWTVDLGETLSDFFGEENERTISPGDTEAFRAVFNETLTDMRALANKQNGLSAHGRDVVVNAIGYRLASIGTRRMALILQDAGLFITPPTPAERARAFAADALNQYVDELALAAEGDLGENDEVAAALADILDLDDRPLRQIIETVADGMYAAIVGDPNARLATASSDGLDHYGRQHPAFQAFMYGTAYSYILLSHDASTSGKVANA